MSKCLFCEIIAGRIPGEMVGQTDSLVAFRDINPQAPVHVLIVPKEHIESMRSLEKKHAPLVGEMALMAQQLAEDVGYGQDYRLVMNTGINAGQSVFHLHMHLLSGRDFTWPPG